MSYIVDIHVWSEESQRFSRLNP